MDSLCPRRLLVAVAMAGAVLHGFEASIAGDVPLGAGLSSSASLQASLAWLVIALGLLPARDQGNDGVAFSLMELAAVLRRSENEFVGVGSGLLDQFSSLFGRADHALFLDCDSLRHERLPLGSPAPAIVVCDSKTSRKLADGMYNRGVPNATALRTRFAISSPSAAATFSFRG